MAGGGGRWINVTSKNSWDKTRLHDSGPSGSGVGGELKTDYFVVPTATMVEQKACFGRTKLLFPKMYVQERRMVQRFNRSLITEVCLVNLL
jgi:hypothetical protein